MKYYLATNENGVFYYGELSDKQTIVSGQSKLFIFSKLDDLKSKLSVYKQGYISDTQKTQLTISAKK
jgi:hypothetical protein